MRRVARLLATGGILGAALLVWRGENQTVVYQQGVCIERGGALVCVSDII